MNRRRGGRRTKADRLSFSFYTSSKSREPCLENIGKEEENKREGRRRGRNRDDEGSLHRERELDRETQIDNLEDTLQFS